MSGLHDVRYRYGLQPHRLPDARNRRVPDAIGFLYLFPSGLWAIVRWIPHGNNNFLCAFMQKFRDIEREWIVTPFVFTGQLPIDKHFATPVYGAEVKQHVFALVVRG